MRMGWFYVCRILRNSYDQMRSSVRSRYSASWRVCRGPCPQGSHILTLPTNWKFAGAPKMGSSPWVQQKKKNPRKEILLFCCQTRTRTQTDRTRICSATITPFGKKFCSFTKSDAKVMLFHETTKKKNKKKLSNSSFNFKLSTFNPKHLHICKFFCTFAT